ncbi:MAG: 50S ribosomal protein L11 methyltransferase [Spirochaetes bacterium]|nr:50S ribosomal protein L11 methyltransferase [Spirochaetota bacterium]
MFQVYFTFDIDRELAAKLEAHAQSISILYDKKAIIALFNSEDEIPVFARDYILSVNTLDEEIWKYRYLDSFNGIAVTSSVFIYPATKANVCDSSYKYCIAINPKDAFGDGTHPTTRMCIQSLEMIAKAIAPELCATYTVCDVGTGTGIIAIAAELFGFGSIDACDIDPVAIERAKENAAYNGCKNINFFVKDIADMQNTKQYKIVVANLLSDIIEKNADVIVSLVEKGGTLIVSGIHDRWAKTVRKLLATYCKLVDDTIMDQWHCMVFNK